MLSLGRWTLTIVACIEVSGSTTAPLSFVLLPAAGLLMPFRDVTPFLMLLPLRDVAMQRCARGSEYTARQFCRRR